MGLLSYKTCITKLYTMKKTTSLLAKIKIRDKRNVVIYYRNRRWTTGVSIASEKEFKNGRLTSNYSGPEDYNVLNEYITGKLNFFNNLILDALRENRDTLDYIDSHLKEEERKLKQLKITLLTPVYEAFEQYLSLKKDEFNDFKKERSFQRYQSELSRLKDFHSIRPSTLGDINIDWIRGLARFLSTPYTKCYEINDTKNERQYTSTKVLKQHNSTIKRTLLDLVSFLNFLKEGHSKLNFPIDKIKKFLNSLKTPEGEPKTVIALTKKQYEALKEYTPRNLDWEIKTYDLFRFTIETGLRYSDAIILDNVYVNEHNVIDMNATKTRGDFKVPMNPEALQIFEKYNRDFKNKFPCNQRININLRKILKRIPEFEKKTIAYKFELGNVIHLNVTAREIITFHSSRRTFVSRAIKRGATMDRIKKWTGWKDLRTLIYYMEIFGEDSTNDLTFLS